MYDAITQGKIASWRQKVIDNTLSLEDMKEAITVLREGRVSAAYSAESKGRKAAVKTIVHADSLLDELDGL
jgi:hypothetical protein